MTGLDLATDTILEVAVVLTDIHFNILEEYSKVVFQPPEALQKMSDWCKKTHGESGLTAAVATGAPLSIVEDEVVALIERHYSKKERIVLVGNSVGNDKMFIERFMPKFSKRLHYRIIDVSSFKELFMNKFGIKFTKPNGHRARADITDSIEELKFYLQYVHL